MKSKSRWISPLIVGVCLGTYTLPLSAQTCLQPITLRQESCPSGPTSCTTGGAGVGGGLTWAQLDKDLINIAGLCNKVGVYTWPSPGVGVLKSDGSGNITIATVGTSDVATDAITYSKIQNVSTNNKLLGRASSGAGDIEELGLGTGLTFSGGNLTLGNALTATALATNGSNCSAGSFPLGVDASGTSESCTALPTTLTGTASQISVSGSTGPITISIPTNPTLPGTTTGTFNGNITGNVTGNVTGNLSGNVTGNSSTATALLSNGSNCSTGSYPLGIDASGNAEGCTSATLQTIQKQADESVTSLTTLQNDDYLVASLVTGTFKVQLELWVTADVASGIQWDKSTTGTVSYSRWHFELWDQDGNIGIASNTFGTGATAGFTSAFIRITGTITMTTSGTLALQWAQGNSGGVSTKIERGSSLVITPLN